MEGLLLHLKTIFAGIANNNFTRNELVTYEGYYASVLYAYLSALGFYSKAEDPTNKGRIDLTLITKTTVYIFEFKVDCKGNAIDQIKEKKYY